MDENKRLEDRDYTGQKNENQEQKKYRHHFQVKYVPKGLFQLFNKNETYIYEKKFSCELPKNIVPPKSFHYPFSLENYCQADLLTMDFDLKKNPEILTDPKINTFIHQDFINNSLELIFPNLTTISKKRTDKEQDFKKKIIEIIESNDEKNQDNSFALREIPDFLRRQTYLRPSTVITNEKKPKAKEKTKPEKKQKTTVQDLKNSIEQSFNDIDKIKIGMKNPDSKKKGVTAKNVYEFCPMEAMPNVKFIEYLFPSEPSDIPNLDEKYLKPSHFLITNNKSNDINEEDTCSLYINNKLVTQKDNIEKDCSEYYTYEKEFASTKMTPSDLFNKYFLILDKNQKKIRIAPLSNKFSFRRYKKITEANINNNQNEKEGKDNNKDNLNKKRKRDIIIVPDSLEKEEVDGKKNWFKDRGYLTGFSERKIKEIDHTDVMQIEKERQKEEELKKQKLELNEEDEDLLGENNNEENEDNIFEEFDDNNDDDNENGNDNSGNEDYEQKSNKDENDEEQNSNEEKNDKSNDSYDLGDNDNDNKSKDEDDDKKDDKDDENKEQDDENIFD